jgi:hypothetical protein
MREYEPEMPIHRLSGFSSALSNLAHHKKDTNARVALTTNIASTLPNMRAIESVFRIAMLECRCNQMSIEYELV